MSPLQAVMFLIAVPALVYCIVQLVREWRWITETQRRVLEGGETANQQPPR